MGTIDDHTYRERAPASCFAEFSSRKPVPTSLENALDRWRPFVKQRPIPSMDRLIFLPMLVQMGLTLIVVLIFLARRRACLRRYGRTINELPSEQGGDVDLPEGPLFDPRTRAARNHIGNLLETPVLFYGLMLAQATLGATRAALILGCAYVLVRAAHAFVHLTYNIGSHRYFLFLVSVGILIVLLGLTAVQIFTVPSTR